MSHTAIRGKGKEEMREGKRKGGTYLREKIKSSQTLQNIFTPLLLLRLGGMINKPSNVPCLCMDVT